MGKKKDIIAAQQETIRRLEARVTELEAELRTSTQLMKAVGEAYKSGALSDGLKALWETFARRSTARGATRPATGSKFDMPEALDDPESAYPQK